MRKNLFFSIILGFVAIFTLCCTTIFLSLYLLWLYSLSEINRLSEVGEKAYAAHKYSEALSAYRQGLEKACVVAAKKSQQEIMLAIGRVYLQLGRFDSHRKEYEQELLQRCRGHRYKAENNHTLGMAYGEFGRYKDAVDRFQQSLALLRRQKDRRLEGTALANLAYGKYRLGQYEQALNYCALSLAKAREKKDRRLESFNLSTLGQVYRSLGHRQQSMGYLEQALALAQQTGSNLIEAETLGMIGENYMALKQPEKALENFTRELNLAREIKHRPAEGRALNSLAKAYIYLKQPDQALTCFNQSLRIAREVKDRSTEARILSSLGWAYIQGGQYLQAQKPLHASLPLALETNDPTLLSVIRWQLGLSAFRLKNYAAALSHYEESLRFIESMREGLTSKETRTTFMEDKLSIYDQYIRLLHDLHQADPTQGYDRKSLEIFERKQGRIFLEEMGKSGARNFSGLPEEVKSRETELEGRLLQLQENLAQERSRPAPASLAVKNLEQQLHQTMIARQKLQAELQTNYPDYYALKYPQPATLANLQQQVLQPGEIILVYGVMPEQTYLWVISREQFIFSVINLGETALADRIKRFRLGMETIQHAIDQGQGMAQLSLTAARNWQQQRPLARDLYRLLFPAEAGKLLDAAKILYLVPTGPLYNLPFEALVRDKDGPGDDLRFLVEDHPISYLSSASLLRTLRESETRKQKKPPYPLLAFANPVYGKVFAEEDLSFQGLRSRSYHRHLGGAFTPLPDTEIEAKAIKDILAAPDTSQPLQLGKAASRSTVFVLNQQHKLQEYRYILFSCHGILPGEVDRVNQPALVLSDPDPADSQPGFLTPADVFGLSLNAELVTLSACNTGRGEVQKGEGIIGLTRAFMYAGTSAVSVTLWPVESSSAKTLSVGFYQNLQQGKSRAVALRASKLRMLRGEAGELFQHPFFWAPMIIFGYGQ